MTPEEESALVRATLRIFHNWKVDDAQACRILGLGDPGQFAGLRAGAFGDITADVLGRMVLILTVHTSLRIWFRNPARGYAWMHRPNALFANLSPIELIMTGDKAALIRLKAYLEAEIQAW